MKNKKGLIICISCVIIAIIIGIVVFIINDNNRKNEEKRREEELNSVRQNTLEFLENAYTVSENSLKENNTTTSENKSETNTSSSTTKQSETGSAGSNISYADNEKQKRADVKAAAENTIKDVYGENVEEITINEIKIYNAEKVQSIQTLAEKNLRENQVAFEIKYDIKLKPGTDMTQYLAGNGEQDGNYIKNKSNCGILRVNGENDFTMEEWGTGF